jgi:hypothetical protein
MPDDASRRSSLLTTALVGALLPADVPEGRMVRSWLDSWSGVGHVLDAMHDAGYNVRLFQSPFVWWAEFCRDEINPLPRWIGRAHDAAPWRAVQRAALETLRQEQAP